MVTKIDGFVCECGRWHKRYAYAYRCCENDVVLTREFRYICDDCEIEYKTEDEALRCCSQHKK